MTTFTYPIEQKRREPDESGPGAVKGKVPAHFITVVSVGQTGTAVGSTTIPLFVAPAGSRVWDATIDILTVANPGVGTTRTAMAIGVPTSAQIIFAATTVNTAGRRTQTLSGAQVSALAIPFASDTTVQALVSIDTSVISTFEAVVNVVLV